jgi:hypothetical protein
VGKLSVRGSRIIKLQTFEYTHTIVRFLKPIVDGVQPGRKRDAWEFDWGYLESEFFQVAVAETTKFSPNGYSRVNKNHEPVDPTPGQVQNADNMDSQKCAGI